MYLKSSFIYFDHFSDAYFAYNLIIIKKYPLSIIKTQRIFVCIS